MNRSQYILQLLKEQFDHPGMMGHPTMPAHHPYQTHHYQSSVPAHHIDSHTGDHDGSPLPKKAGGRVKSFLAGAALGGAGTVYGLHKLVQHAQAHAEHVKTMAHAAAQGVGAP